MMNTDCVACQRAEAIRSGGIESNPFFVAELRESFAVLHDHQKFEGWTVLILKDHAEHLSELSILRQTRLFEDVARMAGAIQKVLSPNRINYECLGNVMAHVHWHVVPRYLPPVDREPRRPIWVLPPSELECGADLSRVMTLAAKLRGMID